MPYAFALRLDEADCAPLTALLQALAASGFAGTPPRITLAAYPDHADPAALAATAAALSVQWKRLTVRFAGLGVFPGEPAVLRLLPVATSALLVRHAQLLARHPAQGPWASGAWVPHVTLSDALPNPAALAAAVSRAAEDFQPFEASLAHVDLIRSDPPELLVSGQLAS
jgi:2'-5' RNA ligase